MPDLAAALLIYDKSYAPWSLDRQKALNCTVLVWGSIILLLKLITHCYSCWCCSAFDAHEDKDEKERSVLCHSQIYVMNLSDAFGRA